MKQYEYTILTILSFFFAYALLYVASESARNGIWLNSPIITLAQVLGYLLIGLAFAGAYATVKVALINFANYDKDVKERRR